MRAKRAPQEPEAERAKDLSHTALVGMAADVVAGIYLVPMAVGMGAHWPLKPEEAERLAEALVAAAEAMPARRKTKALKLMREWMPYLGLAMTAYAITAPRVALTLMERQRGAQPTAGASAEFDRLTGVAGGNQFR